jgi:hypothetical protein
MRWKRFRFSYEFVLHKLRNESNQNFLLGDFSKMTNFYLQKIDLNPDVNISISQY